MGDEERQVRVAKSVMIGERGESGKEGIGLVGEVWERVGVGRGG